MAEPAAGPFADDPHRPRYHFLAPANWMNDPNGLIQWQGEYHIFYQYNPNGAFWGTMHWGHAVSRDLVHWTHLPIALAPTPGSYDEDGCYSGCTVVHNGIPTIIYTGVRGRQELPCLATSDDGLRTWQKHSGNPVIPAPPPGLELIAYRDHSAWREDGLWYQLIGSGVVGAGGTALLYRSSDIVHWEYLHPLYVRDARESDPLRTGTMWECPDFFALDGQHVLIVSAWEAGQPMYPVYFIGRYAGQHFEPGLLRMLDFGGLYAPQTMRDEQGRRLLWGWIPEARSAEAQLAAGWSGVMSLPRQLSLRPDGLLGQAPVLELQALRGRHHHRAGLELAPAGANPLQELQGDTLELLLELEPGEATELELAVRCAPDGREQTRIVYDARGQRLVVDCTRSSLDPGVRQQQYAEPLALAGGEPLRLQVFLDRSVLEVFANGHVCAAVRIYPTLPDSQNLALYASGGSATLKALDVWELGSIWD